MGDAVRSIAWVGPDPGSSSVGAALGRITRDALAAVWPTLEIRRWDEEGAADALRAWHLGGAWRSFNDADVAVHDLRALRRADRWVVDLARRSPGVLLVDDIDRWLHEDRDLVARSTGILAHRAPERPVPAPHRVAPVPLALRGVEAHRHRSAGAVVLAVRGAGPTTVDALGEALGLIDELPLLTWRIVCTHAEADATHEALDRHPTLLAEIRPAAVDDDVRAALDGAVAACLLEDQRAIGARLLAAEADALGLHVVLGAPQRAGPQRCNPPPSIRPGRHLAIDLARAASWLAAAPRAPTDSAGRAAAEHDAVRVGLLLRALIERAPSRQTRAALHALGTHIDAAGGTWLPAAQRHEAIVVGRSLLGRSPTRASTSPLGDLHAATVRARGCLLLSAPKSGTHLGISLLTVLGLRPSEMEGVLLGRELPTGIGEPEVVVLPRGRGTAVRPAREVAAVLRDLSPGRFTWGHVPPQQRAVDVVAASDVAAVLVVRDPRAVVRSLADWYIDEDAGHVWRDDLAGTSLRERIRVAIGVGEHQPSIDRLHRGWSSYLEWSDHPGVVTVRYEDLVGAAGGGSDEAQSAAIAAVLAALGVEASPEELALVGRDLFGGTATFRHGQVERWTLDFGDEELAHLEAVLEAPMRALGYELRTR